MFIYLNICPFDDSLDEFLSDESQKARKLWFNSWTSFYTDLFTQPADQVILTLNRMMKTKTSQDKHGRLRAVKLLKRITSLLSLQYEEIQGLVDMLSAIGGTMGLLTGFSIISGVEMVYFVIKIILNTFKKWQKKKIKHVA